MENVQESLLVKKLQAGFGDRILETNLFKDEISHLLDTSALLEICEFVKNDPELQMNYLVDVLGVDYPNAPQRFEIIYHLYSIPLRHRLRLRVRVAKGERVPSVTGIWPAADWPERETYDMYGVRFEGHPNMKRIYMPPDWEGFPMRKDYPLKGYKDEYNPFGEEREEDF